MKPCFSLWLPVALALGLLTLLGASAGALDPTPGNAPGTQDLTSHIMTSSTLGSPQTESWDEGEEDCTPHPPIVIVGDVGPTGFALGHDPVTGEPIPRPGSGVTGGDGTAEDPYVIEGWCIRTPEAPTETFNAGIQLIHTSAHILVRDNVVTGNPRGVILLASSNVTVQGNSIMENRLQAVSLWSAWDNTVKDNTIQENGLQAVSAGFPNTVRNAVINNTIQDNGDFGVQLWEGTTHSTVKGNTIQGSGDDGVILFRSSFNLIQDNTVLDNGHDGIRVSDGSEENTIENNTIENNGQYGIIILAGSTGNNVSDSTIEGNEDDGVQITINSNDTRLYNNTITHNGGHGLSTGTSHTDLWIHDNTVTHNERDGIVLGIGSHGNSLQNNTVTHNEDSGVRLGENDENNIQNNTLSFNRLHGLSLRSSSQNTIQDNTMTGNARHGLRFSNSGSEANIAQNNVMKNNGWSGIMLQWGAVDHNTFEHNTIKGNDRQGILLETGDDNAFRDNTLLENGFNAPSWVAYGGGIVLDGAGANSFTFNEVSTNVHGFVVLDSNQVTLKDNNIHENHQTGLTAINGQAPVLAEENWWGDPSGPSGGIPDACTGTLADGDGNRIETDDAEVCFDPWLTQANTNAGAT